jgi:hypothetical protein
VVHSIHCLGLQVFSENQSFKESRILFGFAFVGIICSFYFLVCLHIVSLNSPCLLYFDMPLFVSYDKLHQLIQLYICNKKKKKTEHDTL